MNENANDKEKSFVRKNKSKLIVFTLILLGILIVVLLIFVKGYTSATQKYDEIVKELEAEVQRLSDPVAVYEQASKEVDINIINSEIQDIGELATVEYLYTDAGKFEDPAKIFGKDIPFSFTTKSFIAKWDGVIKVGVDISQVVAEIDKNNKIITVHIPDAEILSHEIDNDSIETLDQKDGLFNAVKVEDVRAFDAISKEAMNQRAIENGLLDKAFENAKGIIKKLVCTDVVEEQGYIVRFVEIE